MTEYIKTFEIRWSDLDPNFHVKHSVYYDFGAFIRMSFLNEHGLSAHMLTENKIGPILFREECVFKREILFGDQVSINSLLKKCTSTYSRWTMQHEIFKNAGTLAAIITVDGAWIDTLKRRLCVPTQLVAPTFEQLPKSPDFTFIDHKN